MAQSGVNLAKYGGYWVLPAFVADTTISATGQRSVGDIFGDADGNFLERTLENTKLENLEGITNPKEYAAAVIVTGKQLCQLQMQVEPNTHHILQD